MNQSVKALHFQIDPRSGLPVYRQVMDQIQYYFASGLLDDGDQLPSIRDLARRLSVNPTTIVKAYSELEHEGVITMQRGKGAFISRSAPKLTPTECERALRQSVRQLAVEATQIGADLPTILGMIREEFEQIQGRVSTEAPLPLRVVNES